jgi:hypothetical protein
MAVNKINRADFSNVPYDCKVSDWLEHGYAIGATHAILYFDFYEKQQAMGYVSPGQSLEEKIELVEREHLTSIIACWQYSRQ